MNEKDRSNIKGTIKKCLMESDLITIGEMTFPFFALSLTSQLFELLRKKQKSILDVYEQSDIWWMIMLTASQLFDQPMFSDILKEKVTSEDEKINNYGELRDLLNEQEITDLMIEQEITKATGLILGELEEPEYSYALIHLPNVELNENIEVNEDIIFVGNIKTDPGGYVSAGEPEGFFRIREEDNELFTFRLKLEGSYLLIRQLGKRCSPEFFNPEPLVFKNIKQKLKVFLGLTLIRDIFGVTNISGIPSEREPNYPIGIFTSVEWDEGAEIPSRIAEECDGLIPEAHPEFDDIRAMYSEGDDLKYFSFQKRFFLSDKIELPQTLGELVNSLSIGESISKPMLNMEKGKIVTLPLPYVQGTKSLGAYLREEFGKLRILLDSSDDYAERIKAASLWYLEGRYSDNDTVKFINYTIAIESLLGESNENVPLTQVLSSKCGYWLGKNLKEKEEISRLFKKIYGTRSTIVHRGKTILKKDDNEILKELEAITQRLIKEAIKTFHA